jgi:hypothetical protein
MSASTKATRRQAVKRKPSASETASQQLALRECYRPGVLEQGLKILAQA